MFKCQLVLGFNDGALPFSQLILISRCFFRVSTHKVISRPGQSQGLLYKQFCHSLINLVHEPFLPTALRRPHTQTVRDSSSSYKIDYVIVINREGHQNPISFLKVTVILLKGCILPIGGVAPGRVCACSMRSRLVFKYNDFKFGPIFRHAMKTCCFSLSLLNLVIFQQEVKQVRLSLKYPGLPFIYLL